MDLDAGDLGKPVAVAGCHMWRHLGLGLLKRAHPSSTLEKAPRA